MICLLRFGEIFLKGKNRKYFEDRLVNNIKAFLDSKRGSSKLIRKWNRYIVESEDKLDFTKIFGLVSYSVCARTTKDVENIKEKVLKQISRFKNKKFRVSTRRVTKDTSYTSEELNIALGSFILEKTNARVSLKDFEIELGIEIMDEEAYLFFETVSCFGGLPVGVEGKAALLVEDESSILAGLLMMRRGCEIIPYAYKKQSIDLIEQYAWGTKPELRIIRKVGDMKKGQALILGTTLENLELIKSDLPLLCPLIAFTQQEIKNLLNKYKK